MQQPKPPIIAPKRASVPKPPLASKPELSVKKSGSVKKPDSKVYANVPQPNHYINDVIAKHRGSIAKQTVATDATYGSLSYNEEEPNCYEAAATMHVQRPTQGECFYEEVRGDY